MQITVEEVQMLLGQKDIEIYALHKRIVELEKKVAELTPKQEPKA